MISKEGSLSSFGSDPPAKPAGKRSPATIQRTSAVNPLAHMAHSSAEVAELMRDPPPLGAAKVR